MPPKTVSLTIDEIEFQTTQFPAMRALEVMVELQKASATSGTPNASVTSGFMTGLSAQATKKLVMELLECTQALVHTPTTKLVPLDKQTNIDLIFSGKLKMLFQVIGHVIEVNFADLTEGSEELAPPAPTLDQ